jgi:hypothetical protein
MAYIAPEAIKSKMFLKIAGFDEEEVRSAVRLLVNYSMINGEEEQSTLNIHRLVQEVMRLEVREQVSRSADRKLFLLAPPDHPGFLSWHSV